MPDQYSQTEGERRVVPFKFGPVVPAGGTLLSAAVTVQTVTGTTPAALSGQHIDYEFSEVSVLIETPKAGHRYLVRCTAQISTGETVILEADVQVQY